MMMYRHETETAEIGKERRPLLQQSRGLQGDAAPPAPPASPSLLAPSVAASPYWGVPSPSHKPEGFSPFVAFCFTINYIFGTGFLTIPWAFAQGGLVLSTVMLITVAIFSDMATNYVLETMARAEAMLDTTMHWIKRNPPPGDTTTTEDEKANAPPPPPPPRLVYSPLQTNVKVDYSSVVKFNLPESHVSASSLYGTPPRWTGKTPLLAAGTTSTPHHASEPGTPDANRRLRKVFTGNSHHLERRVLLLQQQPPPPPPKYMVQTRKFEVNALCRTFLGTPALRIYTGFLCLYMYCTLWAYTCVFASALARTAPLFVDNEDLNYLLYALAFAMVVVPLSCMEMDEQVVVQVILTGARFVMVFFMLFTCLLFADDLVNLDEDKSSSDFEPAPLIRLAGIDKMVPIVVFAHIYHHSIPGLAAPVAEKKQLGGIFQSAIVFNTVAYTCIGLVLASTFGSAVEQSSNLMWKGFTGGTGHVNEDGTVVGVALWAKAISLYILLFPAIDVLSVFPLNSMTLGNNMMASVYGRQIHEVENNRWIRIQFRLLASVPPIVLGILERNLGTITDYAGTTGFVIGFSFPAMLYLRSKVIAEKKNFNTDTYYTSYASYNLVAWAIFWFGIIMVLYVVVCLARGGGK